MLPVAPKQISCHLLLMKIISNDTVVACDSYTWIDGISYTESGDYSYVGTNAAGCSEINTLTLTINESTISNDTVISCNEYEWNGVIYNESGDYSFEGINLQWLL